MPIARISLRDDTPFEERRIISEGIHRALIDAIGIPPDDRFQIINRYPAEDLVFDKAFLGIERRNIVFVQITFVHGRTHEQKQALYRHIVTNLAEANVRPEDVHITLEENEPIDWSPGNGDAPLIRANSHVANLR
jgi:phenylpyruvate tautomerase PptA (4-oxalocrotonate tautomerase family)